jgi:hypothetical protein
MSIKGLEEAIKLQSTPRVWTAPPIVDIIQSAPEGSFVLDTGCHKGAWIDAVGSLLGESIKTVGVDILNHGCDGMYDFFFAEALDVEEEERDAYIFAETAINSLHNRNPDLNYRDAPYMSLSNVQKMNTKRLDTLLDSISEVKELHYMKVDCQGNDVNVVKGLGSYLDKITYVQVESTFDTENLYNVPLTYLDDINEMRSLGFTPIYYCVHEKNHSMPREGEILFKRDTGY